ncbi:UNVERIFIED_CONTAM: Sister chromatid cohesion protein PDS5 [Sesamum calycinum]|uniref:Sister chromatid cohesion protein PDS5 n=1 Tax=Sesamum calycinum TaxID=2727403 RepID=A0AAW2LZW1_9LAMI
MPPLSDKELEERLTAAGNSLLQPPSSLDELLPLLDQIEEFLSKVEQSPAKSMQAALSPLMKALVAEELVKHPNVDVKVGVASCISEITRITAPDAPYDDDKMKDVFQLIVSSFENLADTSSRSHEKRATILETVAKVRSCVIMLDLECDQMIIEMFQHFLKSIRVYHAEVIFASMETIMTLVLEESEDISPDLLNPILATLKRNNEAVMPIAKKLAERVIQNSADKLRPYLAQALKSLDASLDDYGEVIASVCRENAGTLGHSNESILEDQPVIERKTSASPARDQVAKDGTEENNSQDKVPTAIRSPKSVVSNGINDTGNLEAITDTNSMKKADSNHQVDAKSISKVESDGCNVEKPVNSESKLEQAEAQQVPHNDEISRSGKEEGELVREETESVDNASKKISEEYISEAKKQRRSGKKRDDETSGKKRDDETSGKKQDDETSDKDKTVAEEGESKNNDDDTSDSEGRSLEQTEKLGDASVKMEDGSSFKKEDGRKVGRAKPLSGKEVLKSSAREDNGKDTVTSPSSPLKSTKDEGIREETPKTSTKRKRTPGTEKASETIEYGENLVGSKVKVWWPKDRMFYEGVIASFDPIKKKHKVLYTDGDKEVLNLRRERWEFIGDDLVSDGDQDGEHSSHDASSDIFYGGYPGTGYFIGTSCVMIDTEGSRLQSIDSSVSPFIGADNVKKNVHFYLIGLKKYSNEGSVTDCAGGMLFFYQAKEEESKLKDTATKSGGKSKDDGKVESESKDNSKSSKKSADDTIKSKDHSQRPGAKNQTDSTKASGRSKDDVVKTPSHSKQDSQRSTKSKGKTPQSGKTPGASGTRMTKSSSSKVKETDRVKEKRAESAKSSETVKGKSTDTAKSRESEISLELDAKLVAPVVLKQKCSSLLKIGYSS